jgi:hypothetical protein
MSKSIPKDVQDAFYRVVHDRDVSKLAAQMGISAGVLYNKANVNESTHHKPTLSDAIVLTNITGDKRIVQALCQSVGGVYYELPDLSNVETDALLSHILKIEVEGGDFHRSIHDALADDNAINKKELAKIEVELHHWIAAILEAFARMREMAR